MALEEGELRIVLRVLGDELLKGMADLRRDVTQATDQVAGSFKHAETAVTQSMGTIRERVSVGLSGVSGSIRAFGEYAAIAFGVLAGERAFANVLRSTQEWAFEVEHLAKELGVSTEQASVYAVAAKEAGLGSEAFDRVARGLIRTLNTHAEAFGNIGVQAKNADGTLRPFPALLTDVLNRLDHYKEGIDRLAAAQSVFGARVQPETLEGLRRWLEALPHATEVAQAFGVVLSEQGVAAAREYQRATADLSLVALGFKETIATALRPELEALITQLVRLGQDGTLKAWAEEGARDIRVAGEALATFGRGLIDHKQLIEAAAAAWLAYRGALISIEVWTAITAAVTTLSTALRTLQAAAAVGAALNALGISMGIAAGEAGLLAGAMTILTGGLNLIIPIVAAGTAGLITYEGWWHRVGDAIRAVFTLITSGPTAALAELNRAASAGFAPLAAHGESPEAAAAGLTAEATGTERFGGTAQARAKAEKAAYDDLKKRQDDDLKFFEKNEQAKLEVVQAYSAAILRIQGLTPEHAREQQTKELEQTRRLADQQRQIADLVVEHDVKNATKQLDEDAKVVETRRKLGLISVADAVAAETDLENRRFVIIQTGLQQRLDLLAQDPNSDPVAKVKVSLDLEDAEREHQDRLTEILRKADADRLAEQKENAKVLGELFAGLGGAFNTALESAVDGTRSRAEVMRSIWQGLLKDVLKIAEEIAATWAKQQVVGAITGTATKATGTTLNDQFSGAVIGGAKSLLGFGGVDPRIGAEQATQAALTAATQHGEAQREQITLASLVRQVAQAAIQNAQRLGRWILTELGMTASTTSGEHARTAAVQHNVIARLALYLFESVRHIAIKLGEALGLVAVDKAANAGSTAADEKLTQHARTVLAANAVIIASEVAAAIEGETEGADYGAGATTAFNAILSSFLIAGNAALGTGGGLGGVLAAAAGGAELDRDMLLFGHKKELVLPVEHSDTIRALGPLVRQLSVTGPHLSLDTLHTSPAVARGVATLHEAFARTAGDGASSVPHVTVNYSTLGFPTEREVLDRHTDHIAMKVARAWAKQGTGKRHP